MFFLLIAFTLIKIGHVSKFSYVENSNKKPLLLMTNFKFLRAHVSNLKTVFDYYDVHLFDGQILSTMNTPYKPSAKNW